MSAFFFRGKGALFFVPSIAGSAGPTLAEITAGVDLSKAIAGINGFETQLNRVQTPVLAYRVEIQSDGPQQFVDSSISIIDDDGTGTDPDSAAYQDAAEALIEDATGYMVFSRSKATPVAGTKLDIYPVRVAAVNPGWGLDAALAQSTVACVITGEPRKKKPALA